VGSVYAFVLDGRCCVIPDSEERFVGSLSSVIAGAALAACSAFTAATGAGRPACVAAVAGVTAVVGVSRRCLRCVVSGIARLCGHVGVSDLYNREAEDSNAIGAHARTNRGSTLDVGVDDLHERTVSDDNSRCAPTVRKVATP